MQAGYEPTHDESLISFIAHTRGKRASAGGSDVRRANTAEQHRYQYHGTRESGATTSNTFGASYGRNSTEQQPASRSL